MSRSRRAGVVLLAALVTGAAAAPVLSPHSPVQQFAGYETAPPMLPRIVSADGRLTAPFVYPLVLVDRLERRYAVDAAHPAPIRLLANGSLVSVDETYGPWLPLGGDPVGRDVFARLLHGARLSLGVACAAALGAVLLGLVIGGPAGFFGGRLETVLMGAADFVLILPAIYLVLAFRAALPLVLSVPDVFWALTLVLSAAGWPVTARGVRAIIAAERRKEYAEAAYALGAGSPRILLRHLLPATSGFVTVMITMMIPAFLLTEGTLTLVGMGFPVPAASWGAMLRDAWENGALTDAPWLLAPAGAIVVTMLAVHLVTAGSAEHGPRAGTFS